MSALCEILEKHIYENGISESELAQLFELITEYTGCNTRQEYAKQNDISYNGAKKHRVNIKAFGTTLVIH